MDDVDPACPINETIKILSAESKSFWGYVYFSLQRANTAKLMESNELNGTPIKFEARTHRGKSLMTLDRPHGFS